MSEPIEELPRPWLAPGETYILSTRSGALHLLASTTDGAGQAARIADGEVTMYALFHANAVAVGPNYRGETALVSDGPIRVGARARYYTLGRDEWWTTSTVQAIEPLPALADRAEFEALADRLAAEDPSVEDQPLADACMRPSPKPANRVPPTTLARSEVLPPCAPDGACADQHPRLVKQRLQLPSCRTTEQRATTDGRSTNRVRRAQQLPSGSTSSTTQSIGRIRRMSDPKHFHSVSEGTERLDLDEWRVDARAKALSELRWLAQVRWVAHLFEAGAREDVLGRVVGLNEAEVARMMRMVRQGFLEAPATAVREVLNLRGVGAITSDVMLDRLGAMSLTTGRYDPTGGTGYLGGNWDDVQGAAGRGLITQAEYESLAEEVLRRGAARMALVCETFPDLAASDALTEVSAILQGWTTHECLLFMALPCPALGGAVPAEVMPSDPQAVVVAAHRAAAQASDAPAD